MSVGKVLPRPERRGRTAPQPAIRATFRLSGGPEAAAHARERLAALGEQLSPLTDARVSLLLTELVTNAVRHGGARDGPPIGVTLEHWPGLTRVSAQRWGIEPSDDSTTVWFELLRD